MDALSGDTPLPVEKLWLEGLRALSPGERLLRTFALTEACWLASERACARAHPEKTVRERDEILLRLRYGDELAGKVMRHCERIGWYDERGIPRRRTHRVEPPAG